MRMTSFLLAYYLKISVVWIVKKKVLNSGLGLFVYFYIDDGKMGYLVDRFLILTNTCNISPTLHSILYSSLYWTLLRPWNVAWLSGVLYLAGNETMKQWDFYPFKVRCPEARCGRLFESRGGKYKVLGMVPDFAPPFFSRHFWFHRRPDFFPPASASGR